jgi:pyruvate formate lyase activating enzyme
VLSRPDRTLRVGGFVAFSTVDFPGRLAAVVFCQGCPWRCRYCHNTHLQPFDGGTMDWPRIEAFLETRRGLLDAVVFSGGEPTAQLELLDAMRAARRLGFKVGLHTAGIYPGRLRRALDYADWVGLDIKAPFERYAATTGCRVSGRSAEDALRIVLLSGVDYDLRTTVHPSLLDEDAKNQIRRNLDRLGARPTRWQEFRAAGCADEELKSAGLASKFDAGQ